LIAHAAAPNEPTYRFEGMIRNIVGVEVSEPGVEALEASDSVRWSVFAIVVWTVCGRGWKMGAGIGADVVFHDPSR